MARRGRKLLAQIRGLFADGGTALYDAVAIAPTSSSRAAGRTDRISAIVVLTDGEDRDSAVSLEALLAEDPFRQRGGGRSAYSRSATARGAQRSVLQAIADATQGRYYEGKPENIREVFKDISTFF